MLAFRDLETATFSGNGTPSRSRHLKRFALDLRQVLFEIAAQHSDFGRFLKACVIQVFQKAR